LLELTKTLAICAALQPLSVETAMASATILSAHALKNICEAIAAIKAGLLALYG
jgi:hypothetical protein